MRRQGDIQLQGSRRDPGIGECDGRPFFSQELLIRAHRRAVSVRGVVTAEEARAGYVPKLLDASTYQFSHFVVPRYPPLAMQARIQGKVELHLTLEADTGQVLHVEAVSGHPLITPSAIDAAKQWRFKPNSIPSQRVSLTLEYALQCP